MNPHELKTPMWPELQEGLVLGEQRVLREGVYFPASLCLSICCSFHRPALSTWGFLVATDICYLIAHNPGRK